MKAQSAPLSRKSFIVRHLAPLLLVALLVPLSIALAAKAARESAALATAPAAPAAALPPTGRTAFDFDGDGKADLAVWRPSDGTWHVLQSSTQTVVSRAWGAAGDRIVPADYDNDGKTDYAVWTPSSGEWSIRKSADGQTLARQWGAATDIPVPGDYDGDGRADIAVWRPSNGYWYITKSSDGDWYAVQFGAGPSGDIPVQGKYDADGKTDIAVWRSSTGVWYIQQSSTETAVWLQWGQPHDMAVPADYDGDGKTDHAVWRPATGNSPPPPGDWWIFNSGSGAVTHAQFGASNPQDTLIPADYDGDGKADLAIRQPSTVTWTIWRSSDSALWYQLFGLSSDVPVQTAFIKRTTIQLSREYIYSGSRLLAVEDANAQP